MDTAELWVGYFFSVGLAAAVASCGGETESSREGLGGNGGATGGQPTGSTTSGGALTGGATQSGGHAGEAAGAGGLPDFCTGPARVRYQGQTLYPGVTCYPSALARSCCTTDSVHLHTRATLGFDLEVDVTEMGGYVGAGEYAVGAGLSSEVGANLRSGTDRPLSGPIMSGTVRFTEPADTTKPRELGLCLEVTDSASTFYGTRIHVPGVNLPGYTSISFDIHLLEDSSLTAVAAQAMDLGSLVLASPPPLVQLDDIVFVEQATGLIGLSREFALGDSVRTEVQGARLDGLPFVVEAGGDRIYLGTFVSSISSVGFSCPTVMVDEISADGFVINPPRFGSDPRNDPRILATLNDAGRLLPP